MSAVVTTDKGYNVSVACAAGDEATAVAPGSLVGTDGIDLEQGIAAVGFTLEMGSGNIAASAYARCFHKNPQTGNWASVPELDVPLNAVARQSSVGFPIPNKRGRLIWLPDAVGGACTVYLNGTRG